MRPHALLALLLAAAARAHVNRDVTRNIDLAAGVVREETAYTVEPSSGAYVFALPLARVPLVASLHVLEKVTRVRVPFVKAGVDTERHLQLYEVPRLPGSKIIVVAASYVGLLQPLPRKVLQNGDQNVVYSGDLYVQSPYPSKRQLTVAKFATTQFVSHTNEPEPVKRMGPEIFYGPYADVAPFASGELRFHYQHKAPYLRFDHLTRTLEVSHWSNLLLVNEECLLRNIGVGLIGEYSRIDYVVRNEQRQKNHVLKDITLTLPAAADSAYFRDHVGNVSWSHFRKERSRSVLTIRPRFPLFGGWQYSWFHGYSLPLGDFVKVVDSKKYVFSVPFLQLPDDMPVKDFALEIVLPEGAVNYEVAAPFEIAKAEESRFFSFFDTIGRVKLTIRKQNVVKEHYQTVQVAYEMDALSAVRKPLAIISAILLFFVGCMVYVRIDTSIDGKKK